MSFNVTSYADLKKVGTGVDGWNLNSDYIQTADIDASASATENPDGSGGYYGFLPIGTYANRFTGSYDGGGHKISNLYIHRTATSYVGLFGFIDIDGNMTKVALENADITGDEYVSGFCGYTEGTITKCYSTGNVSGNYAIGGLAGYINGTADNCYSLVNVTSIVRFVGGFCGRNLGIITNCYSIGSISGNASIGGFCGDDDGIITNCYWDTETSGQTTSSGGEGRTTDEMTYPYAENTYVNWNFETIWHNDTIGDGYPVLMAFLDKYVITKPATNVGPKAAHLHGKVVL